MPFQTWQEVHAEAALGNEEAIQILAEQSEAIAKMKAGGANDPLAAERRRLGAKEEMLELRAEYRDKYPDVFGDEEGQQAAAQEFARLQERNPDTTLRQAYESVALRVQARLGPGETRGYSSAIADMRNFRSQGRRAQATEITATDESYENLPDPESVAINTDYSMTIAQMAESRRGQLNVAAERQRERQAAAEARYNRARRYGESEDA